jgi:DNA-binding CsgD family transcriptional regulator
LATQPSGRIDVIERLRTAAVAAQVRGAPESAPIYLRRALAEGPERRGRAELLFELGMAEKLVRDPACAEHLDQARGLLAEPGSRARAALELSDVLTWAGRWEAALEAIDAGIDDAASVDRALAMRLETSRVNNSLFDSATADQVDHRLPTLRRAAADGSAPPVTLLLLATVDVLRGERLPAAVELVERGLDGGRLLAQEGSGSGALTRALVALAFADELDRLERVLDAMALDARRRGSVFGFVVASGFRVCLQGRRGELHACEDELRRALTLVQEHDLPLPLVFTLWYGTEALVEREALGDLVELAIGLALPPVHGRTLTGAWLAELRGRLLLARGERSRAIAELRACGKIVTALRMHPGVSTWRSTLALALAPDDPAQARELAESELADARRVGLPRSIGVALRTLGLLDSATVGIECLREAEMVLRVSPARLEHARALVELGSALRRANQRAAARDPLRAGVDLALRCGATRLSERARTELAATGARPRRLMLTGRDALTPTEQRIATMAAQGMSNPQIAQALFLTAKTVENQLGRVYKKLGVGGRAGLSHALEN